MGIEVLRWQICDECKRAPVAALRGGLIGQCDSGCRHALDGGRTARGCRRAHHDQLLDTFENHTTVVTVAFSIPARDGRRSRVVAHPDDEGRRGGIALRQNVGRPERGVCDGDRHRVVLQAHSLARSCDVHPECTGNERHSTDVVVEGIARPGPQQGDAPYFGVPVPLGNADIQHWKGPERSMHHAICERRLVGPLRLVGIDTARGRAHAPVGVRTTHTERARSEYRRGVGGPKRRHSPLHATECGLGVEVGDHVVVGVPQVGDLAVGAAQADLHTEQQPREPRGTLRVSNDGL